MGAAARLAAALLLAVAGAGQDISVTDVTVSAPQPFPGEHAVAAADHAAAVAIAAAGPALEAVGEHAAAAASGFLAQASGEHLGESPARPSATEEHPLAQVANEHAPGAAAAEEGAVHGPAAAEGGHGEQPRGEEGAGEEAEGGHGAQAEGAEDEASAGVHRLEVYHPTPQGRAVGYMLVGTITFIMVTYHAVNWFQTKPRVFAWKMISAAVSIFLALTTFHMLEKLLMFFATKEMGVPVVAVQVAFFFIFYSVLQVILYKLKDRPLLLVAAGTIFGHMAAFAAIMTFETLQEHYSDLGPMTLVCVGFYGLCVLIFFMGWHARRRMAEEDQRAHGGHPGEAEAVAEWLEVCYELECDAATMSTGILVSQVVRFLILGDIPPLERHPGGETESQITCLLASGLLAVTLLMVTTHLRKRLARLYSSSACVTHHARMIQGTLAMSTAWIFIFWGQWQYSYVVPTEDKIVMKLHLAVFASAAVFPLLSIFSLQCMAESGVEAKALQALISALGLLVGLSWEKTMRWSLVEVVFEHKEGNDSYLGAFAVAVIVMDIIIGSAWAFFILPKADTHVHGGGAEALWGNMMEGNEVEGNEGSSHSDASEDSESSKVVD